MAAAKPKVTATLARVVLADLSRRMGVTFQFPERISREQARTIIAAITKSPTMAAGLKEMSKTPAGNDAISLYHHVLAHFAWEHAIGTTGEPAPFDRPPHQAQPGQPFAGMHPDDAAGLLAWARTNADYRAAMLDKNHAEHATLVAQTSELYKIIAGAADAGAASPAGVPPLDAAALAAEAARIRATPEFLDKRHPQHRERVDELIALTQRGAEPGAAPAPPAAPATPVGPSPQERIAALQRDPAYADGKHPEHAATVEKMSALYREAYPEPPAAG